MFGWLSRLFGRKKAPTDPTRRYAAPFRRGARMGYDAGKRGRHHNQNWRPAIGLHPDQESGRDLDTIRARSRDLTYNTSIGAAFLERLEDDAIGPDGIRPQPAARFNSGRLREPFNSQIAALWDSWKDQCDVRRICDMTSLQAKAMRAWAESGGVLVHMVVSREPDMLVPLALKAIECDYLADSLVRSDRPDVEIRRGIEIDRVTERIEAFWIRQFRGLDRASELRRIAAREMVYLFRADRFGQVLGVPWSAPVIQAVHDLDDYQESERVKAREFARRTHYIRTPDAEGFLNQRTSVDPGILTGESKNPDTEPKLEEIHIGQREVLRPGEEVIAPDANVPIPQFESFLREMRRNAAMGLGTSYESLIGDHSKTHFSASRATMIRDVRHLRRLQKNFCRMFLTPIYERFVETCVLAGLVEGVSIDRMLADNRYRRNLMRVKWRTPGFAWHDPAKDIEADSRAISLGIKSRQQVCHERGTDFIEIIDDLVEEERIIRDKKLVGMARPGDFKQTLFGGGGTDRRDTPTRRDDRRPDAPKPAPAAAQQSKPEDVTA